jgi:hypothetical protein
LSIRETHWVETPLQLQALGPTRLVDSLLIHVDTRTYDDTFWLLRRLSVDRGRTGPGGPAGMGDPDAEIDLTKAILKAPCGIATAGAVLLQARLPAETPQKPTRSNEG